MYCQMANFPRYYNIMLHVQWQRTEQVHHSAILLILIKTLQREKFIINSAAKKKEEQCLRYCLIFHRQNSGRIYCRERSHAFKRPICYSRSNLGWWGSAIFQWAAASWGVLLETLYARYYEQQQQHQPQQKQRAGKNTFLNTLYFFCWGSGWF